MSHRLNSDPVFRRRPRRLRRGLTLIEMMMVTTILVMMAGAMAALASVVQSGSGFNHEHHVATQNGRVALERIERAIASATANGEFPGCLVYSEQLNGWTYPDTLIVWYPQAPAADPDALPRVNELVVFCPNPNAPAELLEIRLEQSTGPAPALDDTASWQALMADFKFGPNAKRVVLTELLRVAAPIDDDSYPRRGVIRFDVRLRPSAAEWTEFQLGNSNWEDLSWAQGVHGSATGLRQTWCRIEIQLQMSHLSQAGADVAIPFFGSGTIYHELHRP